MKRLASQTVYLFFEWLVPTHFVHIGNAMRARLADCPLTIVDVGAAMGVDDRWPALGRDSCRFVTFEPDERSAQQQGERHWALHVAVGASKGSRTLFLTKGAFGSSLLRHNHPFLQRFANWEWHEPVGEDEVVLDLLDDCLNSRPDWRPDFIKTDAEGTDLDVLKGGEHALSSALGVQVETAFVERHLGTPFFSDIDAFLRARHFTLFQLLREHWIRRNGVFGPGSRPQLIWADVVYFVDLPTIRERLIALETTEARETLLLKFTALLLAYGCHDYAVEVIDDALEQDLVARQCGDEFRQSALELAKGPRWFRLRVATALILATILYLLSLPLGTRARRAMGKLASKLAARLAHHLYRINSRAGPVGSCIADIA